MAQRKSGSVRQADVMTEGEPLESPDFTEQVSQTKELLATRISELRRAQKMTLANLATKVGITAAMMSQIERAVTNPSMATLVRIAFVLGVSVAQLFAVDDPGEGVLRHADRRVIDYPRQDIHDAIISADPHGRFLMLESRIGPHASSGPEGSTHGAEVEFVLVLEGCIEVTVGDDRYQLDAGDTLTFNGALPHGFVNRTDEDIKLIWMISPASW